jgi:hypothetical protein
VTSLVMLCDTGSASTARMVRRGIPDMRFINRKLPITDVARGLDLRLDGARKIHCWHPERHQNGDRTASVGIRTTNNTVKCFGCDSKPMGPIDLVMDVHAMDSPADAAIWIAERFSVPSIPARKHLDGSVRGMRVGYEQGLGLLIRSRLWSRLSEATKAIAPILLELAEKEQPHHEVLQVRISYRAITRHSGIQSPNAVRKALLELSELGFLRLPDPAVPRLLADRATATYTLTPLSNELQELAQASARQSQQEIAAEVELRARKRRERMRKLREEK